MILLVMGVNQLIRDVKPKHIFTTQPGVVGSIGEVVVKPRFRTSTPEMPWRADPYWDKARAARLGNNVQDGDTASFVSKGGPARTIDSKWNGNRSFRHQYGFTFSDTQSPDKRTEPWLSSLGDYSWRRKIATVRNVKRTGQLFSVKPGGYQPEPNDLARGGNFPVGQSYGGTEQYSSEPVAMPEPVVGQGYGGNETRAGVTGFGKQTLTGDVEQERRRLSGLRL